MVPIHGYIRDLMHSLHFFLCASTRGADDAKKHRTHTDECRARANSGRDAYLGTTHRRAPLQTGAVDFESVRVGCFRNRTGERLNA